MESIVTLIVVMLLVLMAMIIIGLGKRRLVLLAKPLQVVINNINMEQVEQLELPSLDTEIKSIRIYI